MAKGGREGKEGGREGGRERRTYRDASLLEADEVVVRDPLVPVLVQEGEGLAL